MTIWTVMFGDDPLSKPTSSVCCSARVKIFNSRRLAYSFRDFCKMQGLYADVVFHPYLPANATVH